MKTRSTHVTHQSTTPSGLDFMAQGHEGATRVARRRRQLVGTALKQVSCRTVPVPSPRIAVSGTRIAPLMEVALPAVSNSYASGSTTA